MKKGVDYLARYEAEQAEFTELRKKAENWTPEEKAKYEAHLALLKRIEDLRQSQYEYVENDTIREYWLEDVYDLFTLTAELQCGRVELSLDEETHTGKITYWGRNLMIPDSDESFQDYTTIFGKSAGFSVESENGLFKIEIMFDTYEKVFAHDKSKEIFALEREFYRPMYLNAQEANEN